MRQAPIRACPPVTAFTCRLSVDSLRLTGRCCIEAGQQQAHSLRWRHGPHHAVQAATQQLRVRRTETARARIRSFSVDVTPARSTGRRCRWQCKADSSTSWGGRATR